MYCTFLSSKKGTPKEYNTFAYDDITEILHPDERDSTVFSYLNSIKESENYKSQYRVKTKRSTAESVIYRVICEYINNTLKHAKANHINIDMNIYNNFLYVDYADDGQGFDYNRAISERRGIG